MPVFAHKRPRREADPTYCRKKRTMHGGENSTEEIRKFMELDFQCLSTVADVLPENAVLFEADKAVDYDGETNAFGQGEETMNETTALGMQSDSKPWDPCSHACSFKASSGFCSVTACVNPKYNHSGTYVVDESGVARRIDDACLHETYPREGNL